MTIDAAWWTALGAPARWSADFSGVHKLYYVGTYYIRWGFYGFPQCYLSPRSYSAYSQDSGIDSGYVYVRNLWPMVLSFRCKVTASTSAVNISNTSWSHPGKIRFRVVRVSDGAVVSTSASVPAVVGTSYTSDVYLGIMTPGVEYRIETNIDATPNILAGDEIPVDYDETFWEGHVQFVAATIGGVDQDILVEHSQILASAQTSIKGGEFRSLTASGESRPQYVTILPPPVLGDFLPIFADYTESAGTLVTPWVRDNPSPVSGGGYPYLGAICTWILAQRGSWQGWIYQPWAYSGTPPEVIAAVCMQAGLDSLWIDTGLFESADASYSDDSPWSALSAAPTLYAARESGRTVADFVYDIIRHTRDLLAVTMSGKLAVISRTSPPTLATLAKDDGVISVEWGYSVDHMFNSVSAKFGGGYIQSGDDSSDPAVSGTFQCSQERNLDTYTGDKWSYEWSSQTSIDRFGDVPMPGKRLSVMVGGAVKERTIASYPMWLDSSIGDALFSHWEAVDSSPLREIRVRQSFIGLDYDVGTSIAAVSITGDGLTVANMVCVEKEIDFDDLRVDSVLLEHPIT